MKKHLAVLGSTGSIGTQALEIIRDYPEQFSVEVLTAQNNHPLLIKQSIEFQPNAVVIANEKHYAEVQKELKGQGIKVYTGQSAITQIVEMEGIDLVLQALVGFSGLEPTLNALRYGKPVALANKETLVVGGELVTDLARKLGVNIYPVDSEHSAIFQCLAGERMQDVEKITLTASGGPFRGWTAGQLEKVTPEQALRHPNWKMGCKVTIDSATLMNKGLEMIEARWLFSMQPSDIDVIIHPQSVVHSLVHFRDGSIKAQLGMPDMRLPILYALSYPGRVASSLPRFSFAGNVSLTFEAPDFSNFRNLKLAYAALDRGGNTPCVLNAANEVAVEAFLKKSLGFREISDLIEQCMVRIPYIHSPGLDDFKQTDEETRRLARQLIK
ncbi:MAG TPA: 1-deoxy-D-xylulose-5-phosphate reductoisomerase [Bacteroidales bacterium]|nr:1-deoxy-D-xylulose-5-phosphate reductoisomerase [Bacteroidales bacterium]HSA43912.1 1-deoxy-D-xylulose-5-phosphate reductoisomerase [Bacteroidales bacterium]